MNHEHAWERLPDLLRQGPRAELLAHVRGCLDCQRRLFLLRRVDRLLRAHGASTAVAPGGRRRRPMIVAALTAAATAAVFLLGSQSATQTGTILLRSASQEVVARAQISPSRGGNQLISLDARGLPAAARSTYTLWALGSNGRRRILVGRFMADRHGSCHAEFTIPGLVRPDALAVTSAATPDRMIATT